MKPLPDRGNPFRQAAAFKSPRFSCLTGRRHSRNLMGIMLLLLLTAFLPLYAQPAIQWDKTLGGTKWDLLRSLQQTSDGGYILGGYSWSPVSGDKTGANRGECDPFEGCRLPDYWVVKLDAAGNKQWDKTIGGSERDELYALQQTADGGYILGGFSISGISGDKTEASRGGADYWVVKLDAAGNKVWDKTFGGEGSDGLTSLQQTSDGGYILGGSSRSYISGDKTEATKEGCVYTAICRSDYWVVKLDATGNKQWDKTIGGDDWDDLHSLQQTADGGYILGGFSISGISGDKTEASRGGADYWVVKLDAAGNKVWDKTIGGESYDKLSSLRQTADVGYILGGTSDSPISGDKTEASKGLADYWVVKLDAAGNKQWDKTIGGDKTDELFSLQQTADGGYILGGASDSPISGDKTEASKGLADYWVVKLDAAGNKQWDIIIGGHRRDLVYSLQQTSDAGYVLGGTTEGGMSGDKTEGSKGKDDYWVVKLAPITATRQVVRLALINTETRQSLQPLREGHEINLAALRTSKLSIRADTYPDTVGSVLFELSGQQTRTQVDNEAPYALFGDSLGAYIVWSPAPGSYTLKTTPYSQPDGQGEAGTPLTIHFTLFSNQVSPQVEWDKTIGGDDADFLRSLQQTLDGGYILGGYSYSPISGDKTEDSRGNYDYWVVKFDAAGNKQWDKTLGGDGNDFLSFLQQTADGGYILGGESNSGISGDKTEALKGACEFGFCRTDYWVVKLDAAGNKVWDKTIGGEGSDDLTSLQQTADGGYILGGSSNSGISGDKTEALKGACEFNFCHPDYWVVKLDAAGNKVWDKTIGGDKTDELFSLQQTPDGGYILGGESYSGISGDKTEANKGACSQYSCTNDYWIVKLDAAGNKQWDKTIGGESVDDFTSLQQTTDGGYLLGGSSSSFISGDKTGDVRGGVCLDRVICFSDYWVVKLDAAGNKVWDKTIGGENDDYLTSLQQTPDGGYILGGFSSSDISGDKTEALKGGCELSFCHSDYWLVKLDAAGNKVWDKTLGGTGSEGLGALQQTLDGGYILGGSSESPISGDKTEANRGDSGFSDFWVVKLAPFEEARQVKSFTLLNTETEQPIRLLQDGDTLDLAELPKKLNIRADTHPDSVGSVVFALSGPQIRLQVDNERPYALFGDMRGGYEKWYPAPGSYTLTAIPFAQPDGQGTEGTPLTIHFTVVRQPAATIAVRMEQAPQAAQASLLPKLMLYPNPTANGRLQVQLPGEVQGRVSYRLLSAAGRKLAEGTVNLANTGMLLGFDFSRQLRAPGLYYLKLEGANLHQVFRIMRR